MSNVVSTLELWGGHECTVNRVGDAYFDQTVRSGHHERAADIPAFTALGLTALRYPLLWERVAPDRPDVCDWRWTDRRLALLRQHNLRVIAGLVHHGSGPRYVDLLSPGFAPGLAQHARRVAERYPWIEDWTPVNEPLTTARFSALYGHWYPHARDERLFWLALLNQIDAVRLSMQAVRAVNSAARLIQTEDLGRTYASAPLAHQARFDNARRWMTWDLLCGFVKPGHPLWKRLVGFGFEDRLRRMLDAPCAPDIVGVNHYLTSDRYLDHRLWRFPGVAAGGNGRDRYVDVEAIRAAERRPGGMEGALEEAWRRYGCSVAVTEAHNACTRDEQVRWFADAWRGARRLRQDGVDIVAVTAWSLLGAYDWDSLLTRERGHYERGAFDVSTGVPRPTALARYLRRLSDDPTAQPEVEGRGWWKRRIRLLYPPARLDARRFAVRGRAVSRRQPLLITGATGTLGQAVARACRHRDLDHVLTSRRQLSLCDERSIASALDRHKPRAVINTAGWVRVDDAERDAVACRMANCAGAILLARACAERDIPVVTFSTDLVFDGALERRYRETDAANPLNTYGASKAEAEQAIAAMGCRALIVRTASFFSPDDPHNFAAWIVRELRAGREVHCAADVTMSPTYVPALADATLDLLQDGETGLWHLANDGAVSWAEFGAAIAKAMRLDPHLVRPRASRELGWMARRPRNSALTSGRGRMLADLDEAVWRFARAVPETPTAIAAAA